MNISHIHKLISVIKWSPSAERLLCASAVGINCLFSRVKSTLLSVASDNLESINVLPAKPAMDIRILGHKVLYEVGLNKMYGERAYHELPIIHIKASRNNTKISLTDCNGRNLCDTSCGSEGFRNARKQTTVAAQTVGISIGLKAQKIGIKDVRVMCRGLGPNRVSTLSGMALAGLNIISLTDDTPIHYGMGRRPKKMPKK